MARSYKKPTCRECASTFHRNARGEGFFEECQKCKDVRRIAHKVARAADDRNQERRSRGTGQAETPEEEQDYESWLSEALVLIANLKAMITAMREAIRKLPVNSPETWKKQANLRRRQEQLSELETLVHKIHGQGTKHEDDEGPDEDGAGKLVLANPKDEYDIDDLEHRSLRGDRLAIKTLAWLARKSLG